MSFHKTQDQCRHDFVSKLLVFADELKAIDDDTPAKPTEEPEWWIEMINLQNTVNALAEKFK